MLWLVLLRPQRLRRVLRWQSTVTSRRVPSYHPEVWGKRNNVLAKKKIISIEGLACTATTTKYSHEHSADLRYSYDSIIRVGEHEWRCPIGREVLSDCAWGTFGGTEIIVCWVETNFWAVQLETEAMRFESLLWAPWSVCECWEGSFGETIGSIL